MSAAAATSPAAAVATASFKQRSKPTLVSKLHVTTKASATGLGDRLARKPNRALGQGKRAVWIGVEEARQLRARLPAPVAAAAPGATLGRKRARPATEASRADTLARLRKSLVARCGETSPPALAFERWLLDSLLQEALAGERGGRDGAAAADPLFGPLCRARDLGSSTLVSDLVRASMPRGAALDVAQALQRQAQTAMEAIASADAALIAQASETTTPGHSELQHPQRMRKRGPQPEANPSGVVSVIKHRHTLDVRLHRRSKRLLKLNHEHYAKLRALWRLARPKDRNDDDDDDDDDDLEEEAEETAFHADLFVLLSRYFALQGHGFQAACPEAVFLSLRRTMGCVHECFASPLNCFYGSYCSAFPDTDGAFGSAGSFWEWRPPAAGGSFQANPPFVANLMLAMVDRIEGFLRRDGESLSSSSSSSSSTSSSSTSPLSFVVVVPGWLEDEAFQKMLESPHLRAQWIVSKADHGFCDGAQHQRRDRFRASPYDTAVFVLQNDAGHAQWPPGAAVEQDLRLAFATGVPTAAAVERRKRDGRGFADADGGGGVYKGKKRQKTGRGVVQRRREEQAGAKKKKTKKKRRNNRGRAKRRQQREQAAGIQLET